MGNQHSVEDLYVVKGANIFLKINLVQAISLSAKQDPWPGCPIYSSCGFEQITSFLHHDISHQRVGS